MKTCPSVDRMAICIRKSAISPRNTADVLRVTFVDWMRLLLPKTSHLRDFCMFCVPETIETAI